MLACEMIQITGNEQRERGPTETNRNRGLSVVGWVDKFGGTETFFATSLSIIRQAHETGICGS